jgi:SHS2 domain-containing protein
MNKERGHETLEHAADMGITGWGRFENEAFEEIAFAMFELIVDGEGIEPNKSVAIRAEGRDSEEMLVDFLNNLIMRADIEELVFLDVEVKMIWGNHATHEFFLDAVAHGVPIKTVRDRLLREVKAVTYCGVSVTNRMEGSSAMVVVDL